MARSKRKGTKSGKASAPTKQIAIRLPPDLIDRIDAYAEQLQEKVPGVSITRTAAIRDLLEHSLSAQNL